MGAPDDRGFGRRYRAWHARRRHAAQPGDASGGYQVDPALGGEIRHGPARHARGRRFTVPVILLIVGVALVFAAAGAVGGYLASDRSQAGGDRLRPGATGPAGSGSASGSSTPPGSSSQTASSPDTSSSDSSTALSSAGRGAAAQPPSGSGPVPAYAQLPGLSGDSASLAQFAVPVTANDPRVLSWLTPQQIQALHGCGAQGGGLGAITGPNGWKLTGWAMQCSSVDAARAALPVLSEAAGPPVTLIHGLVGHAWTPPGSSEVWIDSTYRSANTVVRTRILTSQQIEAAAVAVGDLGLQELNAIYPITTG